ncbi:MAG: response regulator [Thaumarchaeota archaeon]|nr:response regulator [Nitrososphaerota archaeon]
MPDKKIVLADDDLSFIKKLSISEINYLHNKELLQISYFNDIKHSKKNALIIEDSKTLSRLLYDYLKNLGFLNINLCNSGREGMNIFDDLIKLGKIPPIFLDDSLPDVNTRDFVCEIFDKVPEAKIILCTAYDEDDSQIKQLFNFGISACIKKPLRLNDIRNVVKIFEEENTINEIHERNLEDKIITMLKSSDNSLSSIAYCCGVKDKDLLPQMKKLVDQGKVIQLNELKGVSCNRCDSSWLTQLFHCQVCNSGNFRKGTLYEHFSCGNITPAETYKEDKCPKCHKMIKIIGVDYRQMEEYYICNDCDEQFTQLSYDFLCQSCSNYFKLETAKWISNPTYKVRKK